MPKFIVMIEVDDVDDTDTLHEALCVSAYEGVPLGESGYFRDFQVLGVLEQKLSREEATDEQRAAVEGAVLDVLGKKPN